MKITTFHLLWWALILSLHVEAQNPQGFCGTQELHQRLMETNPQYRNEFINMELANRAIIASLSNQRRSGVVATIPVVVHVIHLGEAIGTGSNISDSLIHATIDGVNDIYSNQTGASIDIQIQFCLAVRDPNGNPADGINRVDGSNVPGYVQYGVASSIFPGADPEEINSLSIWPRSDYYNIWVVHNINGPAAAFAGYPTNSQYDGAVIEDGEMTYNTADVLAHELGHAFNLKHTFEGALFGCPIDTNCLFNGDEVCDTPPHKQGDCGTTNPCSSSGTWDNSLLNYMSYCWPKERFTQGQKDRMDAALLLPTRVTLLNSLACVTSTCSVACNDGDPCTVNVCDNGNCSYPLMSCDDGSACTDDSCDGGLCFSTPKICNDPDFCTTDVCAGGNCLYIPTICDDNDPCTADSCSNGTCVFTCPTTVQTGQIKWQKIFGGSNWDQAYSIKETGDGGYIIAGHTKSKDGDVSKNYGNNGSDVWIVKLDKSANIEWEKTYGGTGGDEAYDVVVINGGYMVAATTGSADGDVTNYHGSGDFWIVKLDINGNLVWQKTLGGSGIERAESIQQTIDGGFIVCGTSTSTNGDVTGNHGGIGDIWVVKLDSSGSLTWQKTYGGTGDDFGNSIMQTADSGFIVAGFSNSTDGDISGNKGDYDYWILKLDASGNIGWKKNLGGTKADKAYCVSITDDGYIIAGESSSNNGDVSGAHGSSDYWIVKLDSLGNLSWQKTLGGSSIDNAFSVQQTAEGGYIALGYSKSTNGDVTGNHGFNDFWVVKLSASGNLEWQKSLGGTGYEWGNEIIQTSDGSYVAVGYAESDDGDILMNYGPYDCWIVKLNGTAPPCCNYTIAGSVVSETGIPIPTVTVNLAGTGVQNFITSDSGQYHFIVQDDSCAITPHKNNDSITNNGISTSDILLIRKQILAMPPLPLNTPYKKIAADVDGSKSVSVLDIVNIRKIILQIDSFFPNDRLWVFVPHDYAFDTLNPYTFPVNRTYYNLNSNLINQDFIAIKLGDVNNNWDSTIANKMTAGELKLLLNNYNALPSQEITIPIKVSDFTSITGYQFTLSWDATVLSLLEVNNKALQGYYGEHRKDEGYLTTTWYDEMTKAVSLDDDAVAFELKFKVIGANGSFSPITIGSELTASEAYNENLDLLNIVPANGMVKVGDANLLNTQHSTPITLSVQPNPFSNTTNIIFTLPQDETVTLSIYDIFGREVKQLKAAYQTGKHQIEWNGNDEHGNPLSKGLYHVRMVAGENSMSTKVVIVN